MFSLEDIKKLVEETKDELYSVTESVMEEAEGGLMHKAAFLVTQCTAYQLALDHLVEKLIDADLKNAEEKEAQNE